VRHVQDACVSSDKVCVTAYNGGDTSGSCHGMHRNLRDSLHMQQ